MLTNNFQGNAATRHGKSCEKLALQEYQQKTGEEVSVLGLVINPAVPWLGFSPDGIVFRARQLALLLEIKSPVLGKTHKISTLVDDKKIAYLLREGDSYILRPTHSYYTQVQLGLFLLELDEAHFIVYSEVESLIIQVQKCMDFVDMLVRRLQYVYFTHYLYELVKYVK